MHSSTYRRTNRHFPKSSDRSVWKKRKVRNYSNSHFLLESSYGVYPVDPPVTGKFKKPYGSVRCKVIQPHIQGIVIWRELLKIGKAIEASGLPAKTIRYYEEIGLLNPAQQTNGYGNYSDADLDSLALLKSARNLGV